MSMLRPGGGSEGDAGDPYDGYDRFGRVQEMRWQKTSDSSVLDGWQWGFNEASNRTWQKNLVASSGQDEAYGYDGLYQVIRDAVGTLNTNRTAIGGIPGEEEDFTYDPTGNWLGYRKDADGTIVLDQTRSNNKDNQLTQIDGSSALLAYDRAGNATKVPPGTAGDWSKCYQPVWDAWGRLVEVKNEVGTPVQKNTYDGLTRRITKEADSVVTHTYWSDRWKPLEERIDSATTASRSYLWGQRPGHRDELVLRDRDTDGNGSLDERLYATMDYFNGTSVINTSGDVLERYAYSAFGARRIMAADFSARTASNFDWDFGFKGQFRDAETGWYNYGYRFYVPELGRWINRDPIMERGGVNLYSFVWNNFLYWIDNLGLEPLKCSDPDDQASLDKALDELRKSGGEQSKKDLQAIETSPYPNTIIPVEGGGSDVRPRGGANGRGITVASTPESSPNSFNGTGTGTHTRFDTTQGKAMGFSNQSVLEHEINHIARHNEGKLEMETIDREKNARKAANEGRKNRGETERKTEDLESSNGEKSKSDNFGNNCGCP